MKALLWIGIPIAVVMAASVCFFAFVFFQMIFVSQITEIKVRTKKDFVVLLDGVTVEEVQHNLPPLVREWWPGAGDVPAARQIVLTPENALQEGERVFDKDPNRVVLQLDANSDLPTRVFIGTEIYARDVDKLGGKVAAFEDAPFDGVRYVGGINNRWFLVEADLKEFAHVETRLWQVDRSTLELRLIEEDPYFTFERPPKTFAPEGFSGIVVAIYRGNVSYGYGGHASRPASTLLRAYTPQYPDGVDLASFAFKAGTVVKVDWQDGALLVTGDPSRPPAAGKPPLPPRIWQLRLPG